MPKRLVDVRDGFALFDLVSYGRGGPGRSSGLSPGQVEQIARTVGRTPEVVVKVLPKDSNNARSIQRHIEYIGRRGDLDLETDDGTQLQGKGVGTELLSDWDLDLETHGRESEFTKTRGRPAPKLVHKLMFSMPPGTPPQGVLAAARNFAREEFALKHRYAMVLHTDEPHPHVHVVVKAVSEQGVRLNIRKATLREWRREFARHLRTQRIAANATERFVRGETKLHKLDGIYRATLRGDSTHARARTEAVASELLRGSPRVEPGKSKLLQTRKEVERGWRAASEILVSEGQPDLAAQIRRFVDQMPRPLTEQEYIAEALVGRVKNQRLPLPRSRGSDERAPGQDLRRYHQ
jgi:Relaxase/Mobilisation nuclease domain